MHPRPLRSTLFPYTTLFRSWWLEHIWELCRTNGLPLESAHYIFDLGQEDIQRLNDIDGSRTLRTDRKSTRLNSSHVAISYAVFCLKKKKYSHKRRSTPQPRK